MFARTQLRLPDRTSQDRSAGQLPWRSVLVATVLAVAIGASASVPAASASSHADEVFWRVNEARAERGLAPLARFPSSEQVVRANDDYASTQDAHRISSQNWDFYRGIGANAYAENQGLGSAGTSPARIVAAWIGSPGHAANMFAPGATHLTAATTTVDGRAVFTIHILTAPSVDASDPGPTRPSDTAADTSSDTDAGTSGSNGGSSDAEGGGSEGGGSDDASADADAGPAADPAADPAAEPADADAAAPAEPADPEPDRSAVDPDEVAPFREELGVGGVHRTRDLSESAPPSADASARGFEPAAVEQPAARDETVEVLASGASRGPEPSLPQIGLAALTAVLLAVGMAAMLHRRQQATLRRELQSRSRTPRGRARRASRTATTATARTAAAPPTDTPTATSDSQ